MRPVVAKFFPCSVISFRKHRKNCECCPGHHLIVNHYSSMSWKSLKSLSKVSWNQKWLTHWLTMSPIELSWTANKSGGMGGTPTPFSKFFAGFVGNSSSPIPQKLPNIFWRASYLGFQKDLVKQNWEYDTDVILFFRWNSLFELSGHTETSPKSSQSSEFLPFSSPWSMIYLV